MFCTFCGKARHNNDGLYCRSCGKLDPANQSDVITETGLPAIAASPAVSVLASSPQRDAPLPSPPALRPSYVPAVPLWYRRRMLFHPLLPSGPPTFPGPVIPAA